MLNKLPIETVIARIQNFSLELASDLGMTCREARTLSDDIDAVTEHVALTSGFASTEEMIAEIWKVLGLT